MLRAVRGSGFVEQSAVAGRVMFATFSVWSLSGPAVFAENPNAGVLKLFSPESGRSVFSIQSCLWYHMTSRVIL